MSDATFQQQNPAGPGGALQRLRFWLSAAGFLFRHESRLARRDLAYLLTAGHRWRLRSVLLIVVIGYGLLHLLAFGMVARYAGLTLSADVSVYLSVSGTVLLSSFLMLSQALEKVTRLFYAQGDLDLLATSPIPLRFILLLRILNSAVTTTAMTLFVLLPFVDILTLLGGLHWLSIFGLAIACALAANGVAVVLTTALFDLMGPRRTRIVSQIISAVVGAAFVIGIQVAAILTVGHMSQQAFFDSALMRQHAPGSESLLWLPARAALGDHHALFACLLIGLGALCIPMLLLARHLGDYALATSSAALPTRRKHSRLSWFATTTPALLIWRKEWLLLWRDPWLASQTLMQLLYLIPPALMLWRFYGPDQGALIVLAPVLTMAAGQLAGGLAWLAVSGEDAPDLIATAPISHLRAVIAKIEAVLILVLLVFTPFLLGLAGLSLPMTAVVALGIASASLSSTMIQIWFRRQAKRRYFSRRQTSSRLATFAEAFCSVSWAAAAGLWLRSPVLALVPITVALIILASARSMRPRNT